MSLDELVSADGGVRADVRSGGARPRRSLPRTLLLGAGVAALAVFLLFFELGSGRILTTHEVFVAQCAREMCESGDWLVPRFGGMVRLTKPPLAYWVVAGLGEVAGGIDAWLVRFPSALSAVLLVGLVGVWAGQWYGRNVGVAAALVQATSIYVLMQGRLGEVDMVLCLLMTLSLYLAAMWRPEENWRLAFIRWLGIFALLGLSMLAKGPVGPPLVLAPVGAYLVMQRRWRCLLHLLNPVGLLLLILPAAGWLWAVAERCPEAMAIWRWHTVDRAVGETAFRQPLWFYLIHLPWLVLPWTPLAAVAIPASWRRAWSESDSRERFLWVWFGGQFLLLTLSAGKAKHYLIPALPVVSLWAGHGLVRLASHLRERWRMPAGAVALAVYVTCFVTVVSIVLPAREPRRAVVEFANAITAHVPPEEPLLGYGVDEHIIVFYARHQVQRHDVRTLNEFRAQLQATGTLHVLAPPEFLPTLITVGEVNVLGRMDTDTIAARGLVLARIKARREAASTAAAHSAKSASTY